MNPQYRLDRNIRLDRVIKGAFAIAVPLVLALSSINCTSVGKLIETNNMELALKKAGTQSGAKQKASYFLIAEEYLRINDFENAKQMYEKADTLVYGMEIIGDKLKDSGQTKRALTYYADANTESARQKLLECQMSIYDSYLSSDRLDSAETWLLEADISSEKKANLLFGIGELHVKSGKYSEAERIFEKCDKIESGYNKKGYNSIGASYLNGNQLVEAERYFRKSWNKEAFVTIAGIYKKNGDYENAFRLYLKGDDYSSASQLCEEAVAFYKNGNDKLSVERYSFEKEIIEKRKDTKNTRVLAVLLADKARYFADKGRNDIAKLLYSEAADQNSIILALLKYRYGILASMHSGLGTLAFGEDNGQISETKSEVEKLLAAQKELLTKAGREEDAVEAVSSWKKMQNAVK